VGALGLTGGISVIDKIFQEQGKNIMGQKLIQPNFTPTPKNWSNNDVTVAWLGHASFLINFFGTRILLDPALNSTIGITPVGNYTIGPSRYIASALNSDEVGPIDLLLVSHAHTDHFDYPTLRKLQSSSTLAVTAKNTLPLWTGMNYQSIEELDWRNSKSFAGVLVKAIEGKHWGARIPWRKGMEANSLLLSKNGINLFFGADTGYTELINNNWRAYLSTLLLWVLVLTLPNPLKLNTLRQNKLGKWVKTSQQNGLYPCIGAPSNYPKNRWKNRSLGSSKQQQVK